MASVKSYEYRRLPGPRYIRLLVPDTASLSTDDRLRWSVQVVNLDGGSERSTYFCLSYTWDSPVSTNGLEFAKGAQLKRQIYLDGTTFSVSENLYQAASYLFTTKASIWIDAVCINQDDLQERSAQVAIMGDIYAGAKIVIVWLGSEDADSTVAIPLIESIANALRKSPRKEDVFALAHRAPFNDDEVWSAMGHPVLTIEQWRSIASFFTRKWFERLWILQEAILCDRVGAVCGSSRFTLSFACEVAELIIFGDLAQKITAATGVKGASYHAAFEIGSSGNVFRKGLAYPKQRALHERFFSALTDAEHLASFCGYIWTSNRQRAATDPKDQIYAPMALASRLKPGIDIDLPNPDYSKTVAEVYTEAANFLLRETRSLSLLSYVEDKVFRKQLGLPSWVPDFSVMESPTSINRYFAQFDCTKGWEYGQDIYDSSSTFLPLTGIRLDVISYVLPPSSQHYPLATGLANLRSYPDGTTRLSLLLRTLVTNTFTDPLQPLSAPPIPYDSVRRSFVASTLFDIVLLACHSVDTIPTQSEAVTQFTLQIFFSNLPLLSLLRVSQDTFLNYVHVFTTLIHNRNDALWESSIMNPTRPFQAAVGHKLSARCLVVTRRRGLLGLAAQSVQPGDEVWLFRGAKVPYVVRPVRDDDDDDDDNNKSTDSSGRGLKEKGKEISVDEEDGGPVKTLQQAAGNEENGVEENEEEEGEEITLYEFVGEGFFHGFMDGEAVQMFQGEGKEERTIILQ